MDLTNSNIADFYASNGYYTPIDVLKPDEVAKLMDNYRDYKKTITMNGAIDGKYRFKVHLLARWIWDLIHHPKIISVVKQALGTEDVLCWSTDFNIKNAHSEGYYSWHQDSTYCGLVPVEKFLTAWLAFTPSTAESGCVCFLPKTHHQQLEHVKIPKKNNMLAFGQEVCDRSYLEKHLPSIVHANLMPGQMSMHNSLTVHASGPNISEFPRIGLAIRYIAGDVTKEKRYLHKERVAMVSGSANTEGFDFESMPTSDFSISAFREHEISADLLTKNYFDGQEEQAFKANFSPS